MRMWFLLPLMLVLGALETVLARLAGVVSLRIDLSVMLVVFLSVRSGGAEGAALALLLGLCQDSFSNTPAGLHGLTALATWSGLRIVSRWLIAQRLSVQIGLLLGAGVFARMLSLLLVIGSGADPHLFTIGLAWTPLQLLLQLGLTLPVWSLARRLCDPHDRRLRPARA